MHSVLMSLNLVASLASAAWAITAIRAPATLSRSTSVSPGERFYVRMYAARAVPFGLAAGVLPIWLGASGSGWIVLAAGIAQVADVWIGSTWRNRGMIVGASAGAMVKLATAWFLLRA